MDRNMNQNKRTATDLLPKFFRSEANKKFINGTIDQLIQPGSAEKVSGFIGRKTSRAYSRDDVYLGEVSNQRRNYQLEPAILLRDNLDNVTLYRDYSDYINSVRNYGGNVNNHDRLNRQEMYSWDPHIDFDKFTNYREYYWLPTGPLSVTVSPAEGETLDVETDILGQSEFLSGNGVQFSNGLKVEFVGDVTPSEYTTGFWFVEGVGESIQLVNYDELETPASYASNQVIPFDNAGFDTLPFSDAWRYALTRDYIVINRASPDRNAWSRYNRWFHRDVIIQSRRLNGLSETVDEETRARRPIIEFESGLKLFNYGTQSKQSVDVVDYTTSDIRSTVNETYGYIIDDVDLVAGMRVLSAGENGDGRIYEVISETINGEMVISLVEAGDSTPLGGETVLVTNGSQYAGTILHYQNGEWVTVQEKTGVNQAPLFDIYDQEGVSFSDESKYSGSTFAGSRVFAYSIGNGPDDVELGFPIGYRSIENSGDILFEFPLMADSFEYEEGDLISRGTIDAGYLRQYTDIDSFTYVNGYSSDPTVSKQWVMREYETSPGFTNRFEVDVYDNATGITDLEVIPFVNGDRQKDFTLLSENNRLYVVLSEDVGENDLVVLRTYSKSPKNSNGYYEIPVNLERNPLNGDITDFTLGEVVDHVRSITETHPDYEGSYPGVSNLRDLPDVNRYGTRFVKHSGPVNIPLYHFTSEKYNVIRSLEYVKNEYSKFKRQFVEKSETLGFDGETSVHVDRVIRELSKDKTSSDPFHMSDMAAFGPYNSIVYEVFDSRIELYAISENFSLDELSPRSVLVYHNGRQMIAGYDYEFGPDGFITLISDVNEGDRLEIREYTSTDGSYIPSTPTKLGLYPKTVPHIVVDDTVIEPRVNSSPYQIYGELDDHTRGWFYPVFLNEQEANAYDSTNGGTGTSSSIELKGLNQSLFVPATGSTLGGNQSEELDELPGVTSFIVGHDGSWTKAYGDFRDNLILELEERIYNNIKVDVGEAFNILEFMGSDFIKSELSRDEINKSIRTSFSQWLTFVDVDYTDNSFYTDDDPFTYNYSGSYSYSGNAVPGFWRGIYKHAYGTDRPHVAPWEMLGFTNEPSWWETQYGPAPYTRLNTQMWSDIENGIVNDPRAGEVTYEYLQRPGLSKVIPVDDDGNLLNPIASGLVKGFNQRNASRRFTFGDHAPVETAWRRSSEYPYAILRAMLVNKPAETMGTGYDVSRISRNLAGQLAYGDTDKPIVNSDVVLTNYCDQNIRIQTAGLATIIQDYIVYTRREGCQDYRNEFRNLQVKLGFKLAGFSDKEKLNVLLDSKSPVGESSGLFVPDENYQIVFNTSSPIDIVNYSGVVVERRPSGYIIRGYDDAVSEFEYYLPARNGKRTTFEVGGIAENVADWKQNTRYSDGQFVYHQGKYYRATDNFTSGDSFTVENLAPVPEVPLRGSKRALIPREFDRGETVHLFYGDKLDTFQDVVDFLAGYGELLRDKGLIFDHPSEDKVDNWDQMIREFVYWTTQNWASGSMITLSPSAEHFEFMREFTSVDDIFAQEYDYTLYRSDGRPLLKEEIIIGRDRNRFTVDTVSDNGLYSIELPLVQKEHVVILDNRTVFNDLIYDPEAGYRRDRIKVIGYRSGEWFGSLDVPGFVFDEATVTDWEPWQDYDIGALVRHKQFYYVARNQVTGSEEFKDSQWYQLSDKPESELVSNFDYRINQFEDFYDIDTEGFDIGKQRAAQALIGYSPRQYLSNIINDEVAQFKFYQGFIRDKGTMNALLALFESLGSRSQENLEFYEDWAIQIGRYGAVDNIQSIEVNVTPDDMQESPQTVQFVETKPRDVTDTIMRVSPTEVYDRSCDCEIRPFEKLDTVREVIRTSGYVNEDDIDYIATTHDELRNGDASQIAAGEYIWVTEVGNEPWTVYQHVVTDVTVSQMATSEDQDYPVEGEAYDLYVDQTGTVKVGDYVAISSGGDYRVSGFYPVVEIDGDVITISVPTENSAQAFGEESLVLTTLREVRVSSLSTLDDAIRDNKYSTRRFWVDGELGNWKVIEGTGGFNDPVTVESLNGNFFGYGSAVAANDSGDMVFIGSPENDTVYIYSHDGSDWTGDGELVGQTGSEFGHSIAVSGNGGRLFVGSPQVNTVTVYDRDDNIGNWTETAQIVGSTGSGSWIGTTELGRRVIIGNDSGVEVYELDSGSWNLVDSITGETPEGRIDSDPVAMTTVIATGSDVTVYGLGTGDQFIIPVTSTDEILNVSVSDTGEVIAVTYSDRVDVFENHSGQFDLVQTIGNGEFTRATALSGDNLAVTYLRDFDGSHPTGQSVVIYEYFEGEFVYSGRSDWEFATEVANHDDLVNRDIALVNGYAFTTVFVGDEVAVADSDTKFTVVSPTMGMNSRIRLSRIVDEEYESTPAIPTGGSKFFVLKNREDAYTDVLKDGMDAPDPEMYGSETVGFNVSQIEAETDLKIYGMVYGIYGPDRDIINVGEFTDGGDSTDAVTDHIQSIDVAIGQTQYSELFTGRDFLSMRINFTSGGRVELVDFVALDDETFGDDSVIRTVGDHVNGIIAPDSLSETWVSVTGSGIYDLVDMLVAYGNVNFDTVTLVDVIDPTQSVIFGEVYTIIGKKASDQTNVDGDEFVLRQVSDAYAPELKDGFISTPDPDPASESVKFNMDQINPNTRIFGATFGNDPWDYGKVFTTVYIGGATGLEFINEVTGVSVAVDQTAYSDIFQDEKFISYRIEFTNGAVEFVDLEPYSQSGSAIESLLELNGLEPLNGTYQTITDGVGDIIRGFMDTENLILSETNYPSIDTDDISGDIFLGEIFKVNQIVDVIVDETGADGPYPEPAQYQIDVTLLADTEVKFEIDNSTVFDLVITDDVRDMVSEIISHIGMTRNVNSIIGYGKETSESLWTVTRIPNPVVDINSIAGAYVYNSRTNLLVSHVDYIDPVQGKIAGIADQEISYKLAIDPAFYNTGRVDDPLVKPDIHWGDEHVGKVWWNTLNARFQNAYQGSIKYQKDHWNKLSAGASIDVYEWVESTRLPSEWDELADTDAGVRQGISGQSLYGDDKYSTKLVYDQVSQTFSRRYYFWVTGKTIVPQKEGRNISIQEVSRLIENPRGQQYRYLTFLDDGTFVLNNFESVVTSSEIIIGIKMQIGPKRDQNTHVQYQLLSDGLETSLPSSDVERKWFDSLTGYDKNWKPVPSLDLPVKSRYGIQDRPRQGMFVNRIEAVKQIVERVNSIISGYLIVDEYDISRLFDSEEMPSRESGDYDIAVNSYSELDSVDTSRAEPAIFSVDVEFGRIINVDIVNPGRGYVTAPDLQAIGFEGRDFQATTEIDNNGKITEVNIIDYGELYPDDVTVECRKFTALVMGDESVAGRWSLYSWDDNTGWSREQVQSYDVSRYWDYVDWYRDGYNQFTVVDYEIGAYYELEQLDDSIGDIIRIRNMGSGGWMMVEKVSAAQSLDVISDYSVVGREKGTIQFNRSLYDPEFSVIGYDNRSYDRHLMDKVVATELRIVMETIRDGIFIGELAVEYNQLFISSLRHVLSEQPYVDWLFKTSFVRAVHNVGELEQKVNFKSDNLESYEEYVNEVKPYTTKIREYISAYGAREDAPIVVTDFDVPPVYNPDTGRSEPSQATVDSTGIQYGDYDYSGIAKPWSENNTYYVSEVLISDGGSGYTSPPSVEFVSETGSGAEAVAYVNNGKVRQIVVTESGSGYLSAPDLVIDPPQNGEIAQASVVIDNDTVRKSHIKVKFDRITGESEITSYEDLKETETFTGVGNRTEYKLSNPMSLDRRSINVYIDGDMIFQSGYDYRNVTEIVDGVTVQRGVITFTDAPSLNAEIVVEYYKTIDMLHAADRVMAAYSPTSTMPGKDLAQVMEGIDYGGVEVTSYGFGGFNGWDSQGWTESPWDIESGVIEDIVVYVDGSTTSVQLSEYLDQTVDYNIYLGDVDRSNRENDIRLDYHELGTAEQEERNPNATITTADFNTDIKADGEIDIADLGITISEPKAIIIRKSTSDGSIQRLVTSYDTSYVGGTLDTDSSGTYTTAMGINPEDVVVYGDRFVTPTNSGGPEELVPGTVNDVLDLQVYQRSQAAPSVISSNVTIADGTTDTFMFSEIPGSDESVIVKVDDAILEFSDYDVNWSDNTVTLTAGSPAQGTEVLVISVTQTAVSGVEDVGRQFGDGSKTEFVTSAVYSDESEAFVRVNGVETTVELVEQDVSNLTTIKFSTAPASGAAIDYVVFTGNIGEVSRIVGETFNSGGSQFATQLVDDPTLPVRNNSIVTVGDRMLSPGYTVVYFLNGTNHTDLKVESSQYPVGSFRGSDINVYVNGEFIKENSDWFWDSLDNRVVLNGEYAITGNRIDITLLVESEYRFDGSELILTQPANVGEPVTVRQLVDKGTPTVERYSYFVGDRSGSDSDSDRLANLQRGKFILRDRALDTEYVWIAVNGELLTPNVDYSLLKDRRTVFFVSAINDGDRIDIVHFVDMNTSQGFGFRIFKDMLNRYHFKKLGSGETTLARELYWNSTKIEVFDGSVLTGPSPSQNRPGVIFVNGERIEYFTINGNVLGQLRRGTLGTGVADVYGVGTAVVDQSHTKTIPYSERVTEAVVRISENTNVFEFDIDSGDEEMDAVTVFLAGYRLKKDGSQYSIESSGGTTTITFDVDNLPGLLVTDVGGGKYIKQDIDLKMVLRTGSIWVPKDVSLGSGTNEISRFLIS